MTLSSILLLAASLFSQRSIATTNDTTSVIPLHDNNSNCTCYAIYSSNSTANSTAATASDYSYFLYHRFYDFRELPLSAAAFNTSSWELDWAIQDWSRNVSDTSSYDMENKDSNVYMSGSDDSVTPSTSNETLADSEARYLVLLTQRKTEDLQTTAEVENLQKNMLHASLRYRVRVHGGAGAIAGLFTYYNDTNESDIEIRTSDTDTEYRFTNQPTVDSEGDTIAAASRAISDLPAWDHWHTLRMDWLPNVTRWYIDNEFIVENKFGVPMEPSGLIMNMWSNGGSWSGNTTVGQSAQINIQWVEVVFNTSGDRSGPDETTADKRSLPLSGAKNSGEVDGSAVKDLSKRASSQCTYVCVIDDVKKVGYPQRRANMAIKQTGDFNRWTFAALATVFAILWF